jgi:Ca2+:H+ antiporter
MSSVINDASHFLIFLSSYLVLIAGFYFAPPTAVDIDQGHNAASAALREYPPLTVWQTLRWYLTAKP